MAVTWVVTWYTAVTSIANESAALTCEIDHVTSFSTNQRAGKTVIGQPEACTVDHVKGVDTTECILLTSISLFQNCRQD